MENFDSIVDNFFRQITFSSYVLPHYFIPLVLCLVALALMIALGLFFRTLNPFVLIAPFALLLSTPFLPYVMSTLYQKEINPSHYDQYRNRYAEAFKKCHVDFCELVIQPSREDAAHSSYLNATKSDLKEDVLDIGGSSPLTYIEGNLHLDERKEVKYAYGKVLSVSRRHGDGPAVIYVKLTDAPDNDIASWGIYKMTINDFMLRLYPFYYDGLVFDRDQKDKPAFDIDTGYDSGEKAQFMNSVGR